MDANVLRKLKRAFSDDYAVVYECRRCGTTAEAESDLCSSCSNDGIARYEIP